MTYLSELENRTSGKGGGYLASLEARAKSRPAPKGPKTPSLVGQIRNSVFGAITGLPALAGMAKDTVASGGLPVRLKDAITGEGREDFQRFKAENPDLDPFEAIIGHMGKTDPITAEQIAALQRTGGRVANPSRYGKASREGKIVDAVVEDVGNLALLGGPVAKGLTSGTVATKAAQGSRLAKGAMAVADVAEHPLIRPTQAAGRAVKKGATTPFGAKEASLAGRLVASEGTKRGTLARLIQDTAETRPVRAEIASQLGVEGARARSDILTPIGKFQRVVDDPLEQQAVIIRVRGDAEALAPLVRRYRDGDLPEPEFRAAVDAYNAPSAPTAGRITPEGLLLAVDAPDPKVAARLAEGETHLREATAVAKERYQAGWGRLDEGEGDVAQFGDDPLPDVVAGRTSRLSALVDERRARAETAEGRAGTARERLAEVEALRADELDAKAAGFRAEAQTKRADLTILAGDKAASLRRQADATDALAPKPPPSTLAVGRQQGRAAEQAGSMRRLARTTEAKAPDSRAIAQADLKADLAAKRAERIRTGKATIVTDDGRVSVARRDADLASQAASREARALERSVARLEKRTAAARLAPTSAPARLRPAIIGARRVAEVMEEQAAAADLAAPGSGQVIRDAMAELPTDIDKLRESGLASRIEHVMTGLAGEQDGPRLVNPSGMRVQGRKLAAENVRTGTTTPMTAQGLAKLYDQETRKAIGNRVAQRVAESYGKTPADLGLDGLKGEALLERARALGYAPYQVTTGGTLNPATAGPNTMFMPQALAREFKGWTSTRWKMDEWFSATYDPAMGVFRTGVLALSPRWHLGNVVGNALLATVSAGMNPVDLVRYGREAKRLMAAGDFTGRAGTGQAMAVRGAGLTNEASDVLRPIRAGREPGKVRKGARAAVQKSYDVNRVIDDLARTAVYLRDLDKTGDPTAAMKSTLRTMGNFGKMTATERAVVRRIFPFYAWAREITKISFRLPYDHPYRVAWTLHLGANLGGGADQQAALPDWAKGALPIGDDQLLRLSFLNPFGDVSEPFVTPKGAVKSLSPAIKLALEAGINRKGELKPLSAPTGTDDGMAPIGWRPAGSKLLGILPQTRALRDLPGDRVVRYGNTDPVLRSGRTIDASSPGGRFALLAQAAGVPWPTFGQSEADKARSAKTEARDEKARATYDRKRKAAGKRPPAKR